MSDKTDAVIEVASKNPKVTRIIVVAAAALVAVGVSTWIRNRKDTTEVTVDGEKLEVYNDAS